MCRYEGTPASQVIDAIDKTCGVQRGDTWFFLANGGPNSAKTCNIPKGVSILAPVFNAEYDKTATGITGNGAILNYCKSLTAGVSGVSVTLDGVELPVVTVESKDGFPVTVPAENFYGWDCTSKPGQCCNPNPAPKDNKKSLCVANPNPWYAYGLWIYIPASQLKVGEQLFATTAFFTDALLTGGQTIDIGGKNKLVVS